MPRLQYPATNPEAFAADAMLIADMGSVRPGVPTLTIALRGMAQVTIEVTTLATPSTAANTAAPLRMGCSRSCARSRACTTRTATLPCPASDARSGTGATFSEEEFRELAEIEPGLPLLGTGYWLRLWSGPAITVTGIDVPSVENALNAVSPYARAS